MLLDHCKRPITYLRFSVTEQCNLRCAYCRFGEKHNFSPVESLLALDDCVRLAKIFASLGIKKIRITGGEPLLREDILDLIQKIRSVGGDLEIAMTTNAMLLEQKAGLLKEAGLQSINISLDSLRRRSFMDITGADKLEDVLVGIEAARSFEFESVGINVVVMKNMNFTEVDDFISFAIDKKVNVRFIELMETSATAGFFKDEYVSGQEVFKRIASRVPLVPLELFNESTDWTGTASAYPSDEVVLYRSAKDTAGPARYFRIKGTQSSVGFISPYREDFCDTCNRIRLDSRGVLYPCLFSSGACNLLELLKIGASDEELSDTIIWHVRGKQMARGDYHGSGEHRGPDMFRIGG